MFMLRSQEVESLWLGWPPNFSTTRLTFERNVSITSGWIALKIRINCLHLSIQRHHPVPITQRYPLTMAQIKLTIPQYFSESCRSEALLNNAGDHLFFGASVPWSLAPFSEMADRLLQTSPALGNKKNHPKINYTISVVPFLMSSLLHSYSPSQGNSPFQPAQGPEN